MDHLIQVENDVSALIAKIGTDYSLPSLKEITETDKITNSIDLVDSLYTFSKSISENFHKSILAGDHYYTDSIKTIEKIINGIENLGFQYDRIAKIYCGEFINRYINEEYFERLNKYSSLYLELAHYVQDRLNDIENKILFIDEHFTREISSGEIEKTILDLNRILKSQKIAKEQMQGLALFKINVRLAYIDNNLECNKELISDLDILSRFLQKEVFNDLDLAEILKDKCQFLFNKTFIRFRKEKVRFFEDDHKDRSYFGNEKNVEIFNEFYKITSERYGNKETFNFYARHEQFENLEKAIYTSELSPNIAYKKENNEPLFNQIHKLSKYYYKNFNHIPDSIERSEKLFKFFKQKELKSNFSKLGLFDQYAVHSLRTLLAKNYLKTIALRTQKFIDDKDITKARFYLDRLREKTSLITTIEEETKCHDCYPYKIILEPFIKYLEYSETQSDSEIDLNTLSLFVDEILQLFKRYKENLGWVREKKFIPLYMPFDQCIIDYTYKKKPYKLFIDSTYLLPIDYDSLENQYAELVERFTKIRILYTLKLIRETNTEDAKNLKKEIKKKISQNQIRSIEIVTLFTAVIAFLIGSIGLLSKDFPINLLFLFMFGFTICLSLFVILIHYVVLDHFKPKILIGVSVATLSFTVMFFLQTKSIDTSINISTNKSTQNTPDINIYNQATSSIKDTCCTKTIKPNPPVKKPVPTSCDSIVMRLREIISNR